MALPPSEDTKPEKNPCSNFPPWARRCALCRCVNHTGASAKCAPFGNINKNSWLVFETRRDARLYRAIVMNYLRRAGMHVFTEGHQLIDVEINFLRAFIVKSRFSARLTPNTLKFLYRRASRRVFGIINNVDIELQPRLSGICNAARNIG